MSGDREGGAACRGVGTRGRFPGVARSFDLNPRCAAREVGRRPPPPATPLCGWGRCGPSAACAARTPSLPVRWAQPGCARRWGMQAWGEQQRRCHRLSHRGPQPRPAPKRRSRGGPGRLRAVAGSSRGPLPVLRSPIQDLGWRCQGALGAWGARREVLAAAGVTKL